MRADFKQLQLRQMDAQLSACKAQPVPARPPRGWIYAIRTTLGMSAASLAQRLGVTAAAAYKFEKAEANETLSVGNLRRLADALDCELRYVLVPRSSLSSQLEQQAMKVARNRIAPVAHTMALEDQAPDPAQMQRQIEMEAQALLKGPRRYLW